MPWRKNLKSGTAAGGGGTTNVQKASQPGPTPPQPEQPKTTKLQINLKSVKKPDAQPHPHQSDKLPPVQLNPVLPENKSTTSKPPSGKTIPITIQKTSDSQQSSKPPVPTTTIPIQRPHNEPHLNKTTATPVKTESKLKSKPPAESSVKTKSSSKATDSKQSPAPPEPKMVPAPPPAPPPPPGGPPPPPPPPGGPKGKIVIFFYFWTF